jgi:hypothetical protein
LQPAGSSGSRRASGGQRPPRGRACCHTRWPCRPWLVASHQLPPHTRLCALPWACRGRRRTRVQRWWRGGTPARPGAKKTSVKEPPVIRRHRRPRESQLCRCPNGIMSWWSPGVIVRAAGPYETLNLSAPPSRKRSRAEAAHAAPHGIGRPIELSLRCLSARDRKIPECGVVNGRCVTRVPWVRRGQSQAPSPHPRPNSCCAIRMVRCGFPWTLTSMCTPEGVGHGGVIEGELNRVCGRYAWTMLCR